MKKHTNTIKCYHGMKEKNDESSGCLHCILALFVIALFIGLAAFCNHQIEKYEPSKIEVDNL